MVHSQLSHSQARGAFCLSADGSIAYRYWVKHPVLLDLRPADCVTTSASNTGCFAMGRPKGSKNGEHTLVRNVCEGCGKPFHTFPAQTRRYCGDSCYQASRGKQIERKCLRCNRRFFVYESDIKRDGRSGIYCSRDCRHAAGRVERKCTHCGSVFIETKSRTDEGKGKYCSRECLAAANPTQGGSVQRHCEACGKQFYTSPSKLGKGGGRYCCRSCSKQGDSNPQWVGGHTVVYPLQWNRALRELIRKRDGYICRMCGGKGRDVHHIDYNKNNCADSNLITLCHSCHSKTNTNREYWLGYFRRLQ